MPPISEEFADKISSNDVETIELPDNLIYSDKSCQNNPENVSEPPEIITEEETDLPELEKQVNDDSSASETLNSVTEEEKSSPAYKDTCTTPVELVEEEKSESDVLDLNMSSLQSLSGEEDEYEEFITHSEAVLKMHSDQHSFLDGALDIDLLKIGEETMNSILNHGTNSSFHASEAPINYKTTDTLVSSLDEHVSDQDAILEDGFVPSEEYEKIMLEYQAKIAQVEDLKRQLMQFNKKTL